jgi:hypothetical protein
MNKIYYFPTWEEQKNIMISLDESYITLKCRVIKDENGDILGINNKWIKNVKRGAKLYICENSSFSLSIANDPILAKLCELTEAKMYGNYLVYNPYNLTMFITIDHKTYNIFQEYSKFLCNEENNWNKCKIILKPLDN